MAKHLKVFESFQDDLDPNNDLRSHTVEVIQDLQDSHDGVRVTPGIMIVVDSKYHYSNFLPYGNKKDYTVSNEAFEVVILTNESSEKAGLDEGNVIVYYSSITDESARNLKAMSDFIERIKTIDDRIKFYRNQYFKPRNSKQTEDRLIIVLPS